MREIELRGNHKERYSTEGVMRMRTEAAFGMIMIHSVGLTQDDSKRGGPERKRYMKIL